MNNLYILGILILVAAIIYFGYLEIKKLYNKLDEQNDTIAKIMQNSMHVQHSPIPQHHIEQFPSPEISKEIKEENNGQNEIDSQKHLNVDSDSDSDESETEE